MKNAGDEGMRLVLRIEKGTFENIDGYIELIKKCSSNEGTLKAVNQALDKADDLIAKGQNKALLRFEDNPPNYDVDLGIKTTPNASTYLEAYQFKTNKAVLSSSSLQVASAQLYDAPSNKRIVEFKLVASDNLNAIQSNPELLKEFDYYLRRKAFSADPAKRVVIDEFHLIFTDGKKVKVVIDNGKVEFISF